jgi:uncharacterized membrane protein
MLKFYEVLDKISSAAFSISLVGGIMGLGAIIYTIIGLDGMRIIVIFSGFFFVIHLVLLIFSLFLDKFQNSKNEQQTSSDK